MSHPVAKVAVDRSSNSVLSNVVALLLTVVAISSLHHRLSWYFAGPGNVSWSITVEAPWPPIFSPAVTFLGQALHKLYDVSKIFGCEIGSWLNHWFERFDQLCQLVYFLLKDRAFSQRVDCFSLCSSFFGFIKTVNRL